MKVALVCDWYHPRIGGIELHLRDLAVRLRGAGHEVVVITPTPGDEIVEGTRVVRISAPVAPRFGFLVTPGGIRAIGDTLSRERVDIAHCHVSIVSPAALGGAGEAVKRGVPAVLTFHSMVPQTGLLARATAMVTGVASWPVRFSAVSSVIAREVGPISSGRPISILSNGIDTEFWRAAASPREEDGKLELISVLRLNRKKLPATLVALMAHLRRTHPELSNVRLRIVGDGPERPMMEALVAREGFGDRIELLGHRSREEIRVLLANSDIFVLPTVRESFGLAALEARCVGLPVVARRSSGVSEFIQHDRDGLLADSHADLFRCVADLATDPTRRARIAGHNREAPPRFDWSTVIGDHLAIYREAIALRDSARDEKAM